MADAVQVEFGAKTDGIDQGAAAVSAKLKSLQSDTDAMASHFQTAGDTINAAMAKAGDSMKELESGFTAVFEALKKGSLSEGTLLKFLLGGAIGGALAEIVKSVRDMGDEFEELEKHAKEATLTIQQYAALQKAVKDDVDADKFAAGIEAAAKKWNDLNHGVSEQKKLLELNGVSLKDNNGQLISFTDYLLIASRLIENSKSELDRFKIGEILLGPSREWVRALQEGPDELKKATNEATKAADEHTKLIAKAHEFSEKWKKATADWGDKFKAVMLELFPYIEQMVQYFLWLFDVWAKIVALSGFGPKLAEAITPAEHAAIRLRNSMQSVKEQFDEATGSGNRFRDTFEAVGARSSTLATQFRGVVDQMSPLPKVWQDVYNGIKASDAAIKQLGEEDFFSKSGTKIPVKDQFDKTAMREFEAELDKIKEKYQEQKIIEQTAVDTFAQTEYQKVAHLKAALAQRESAMDAVFAEEVMKYGDNAARLAQIELNFQKQKHQIDLEGLKLEEDLMKKRAQDWNSALSSISGAFSSQLRGLLQGTTTWAQATKNIATDLVVKIIDEFIKLAIIQPLIQGFLKAGFAAPTELFTGLITIIKNMFGPLLAGFTAFFAPAQGPAAPAEGAALASATVAAATAAVQLDTGTDYVPRTGLAMIHQGEAIIPASENMGQYSGGGGHSFNINLSAVDVQSFNAWLRNGGGANMLAKMISDTLRRSPTLRPSY